MEAESKEVKFSIEGMDCADCALSLERSLAQIKGVEHVNINYTTGLMEASGTFNPLELVKRVQALGYKALEPGAAGTRTSSSPEALVKEGLQLPGFLGY